MRRAVGSYEIDDDPARVDAGAAVAFLTTQAYWGRWRGEPDIRRQMPRGFGPLLSFQVSPDSVSQDSADAADKVVASSELILPATSFGGVESTWERRARWPAEAAPAGLIRLSVGVEPAGDLITDIDQALEVL